MLFQKKFNIKLIRLYKIRNKALSILAISFDNPKIINIFFLIAKLALRKRAFVPLQFASLNTFNNKF